MAKNAIQHCCEMGKRKIISIGVGNPSGIGNWEDQGFDGILLEGTFQK